MSSIRIVLGKLCDRLGLGWPALFLGLCLALMLAGCGGSADSPPEQSPYYAAVSSGECTQHYPSNTCTVPGAWEADCTIAAPPEPSCKLVSPGVYCCDPEAQ